MASCKYSSYVGGPCGASRLNPSIVQCLSITECNKDIKAHLRSLDVRNASLSEAKLLLARAGICTRCRKRLDEPVPVVPELCLTGPLKRLEIDPMPEREHTAGNPSADKEETSLLVETEKDNSLLQRLYCGVAVFSIVDFVFLFQEQPQDVSELCQAFLNLSIEEKDSSVYIPEESNGSSTEASNGQTNPEESLTTRRQHLNRFLESCNIQPKIGPCKKSWEEASARTRSNHMQRAKDVVVTSLNVITPGDEVLLWEALQSSRLVEKDLGCEESSPADEKYLLSLAETYENASTWDTRRQALSVMADLVPFKRLQKYLPGITEYRVKVARQHRLVFGRGVPVPPVRSPRMRVDNSQLDHFLTFITSSHVMQDLPFGQRYLRLSTGEVLETPNVIRTMIPERIVRQYQQYCEETGFEPFGRTTMVNILSACCATVRKSLQGLDYVATEGSRAFDDLCFVVKRLQDCGAISRDMTECLQRSLKNGKQYLKSDFKVHVSSSSAVADHCSTYALSDVKESRFSSSCNHVHDKTCSQCEDLTHVLRDTQAVLVKDDVTLEEDELVDLRYTCQQAVQDIHSWKAHQLRSTRQDMARLDVLKSLDASSVLITNDWAMKFLPQKYRESQAEWFAKRGISWHISVVLRVIDGDMQTQTFVHVVENCSQDASVVIRIIEHILRTLKEENDNITEAYLRQDNAGCYHSAVTLASCCFMKTKTGIRVSRVDFSDPQSGKGPCDRKAATIKAHVRRFINEGHDVSTAQQFRNSILSSGGVPGVRVALVDAANLSDTPVKWDGISLQSNFQYFEGKITVWRAYNIGCGKIVQKDDLQARPFQTTLRPPFTAGSFTSISVEVQRSRKRPEVVAAPQVKEQQLSVGLFQCTNEGCIKVYQSHSALEKHVLYEKCELREE
ncbi:hypothetical protein QZH41_013835, partial [Actinostola sp. cb2023]